MAEEGKKPSFWEKIKQVFDKVYNSPQLQKAREISDSKHAAPLWAEWRRGLKDLQDAALNPWNGVTQKHEEVGSIASPTQFQVNKAVGEVGNVYGSKEKKVALTDAPQAPSPAVEAPKIEPAATTKESTKMSPEETAPPVESPAQGSPEAFDAMMAQHAATVQPEPQQTQEMER